LRYEQHWRLVARWRASRSVKYQTETLPKNSYRLIISVTDGRRTTTDAIAASPAKQAAMAFRRLEV
jgi:hypothetical protein